MSDSGSSDGEDGEEGSEVENEAAEEGSLTEERKGNREKSGKTAGMRGEMATLRAELGESMESVPLGGESLRQFFARTTAYWNNQVVIAWRERGEEERSALINPE